MSSPRRPFAAMALGSMGALDEAVLIGSPPTVRELARSSGLPPWAMTPGRALKSSSGTRIIV
ncbi:MAG: hypothetical protein WKF42_04810 [Solirubrobacteraceae bacterium]